LAVSNAIFRSETFERIRTRLVYLPVSYPFFLGNS